MLVHKALQCLLVRGRHDLGGHLLGHAVFCTDNRCLAHRPPSGVGQGLPAGVAHVLALPAKVRFVYFHGTGEPCPVLRQRCPEPLRQKPRGFLRNPQIAVEFHARNTLEVGHNIKRGDDPVLIADLRAFHNRARLGAELLDAFLFTAPIRHGLVLGSSLHIQ